MDNVKNDKFYVDKIIDDINFIIKHTNNITKEEFESDNVINSAISFKFIQISENSRHISQETINNYPLVEWKSIVGLRNRIVHDYGNVNLTIIYKTCKENLNVLLVQLLEIRRTLN